MNGYYWWVPPGGDTGPIKCALWQQASSPLVFSDGTLVDGSVVTSGTLIAGQWNFVALPSPLLLTNVGTFYTAAIGFSTAIGFPDTKNQFGGGQPYASGISNGPLTAPGSSGIGSGWQQPFSTAGSDPSVTMPVSNDANDLLWIDVQVTDVPPAGASYRLWPSRPYSIGDGANGGVSVVTDGYNMSVQFSLSESCNLSKIWFYSAPAKFGGAAAVALPTRCAIWDTTTQTVVNGTDINGVTWKKTDGTNASAGDGWVYCDYSSANVVLDPSKNYKSSVWYVGGSVWRTVVDTYWSTGYGQNGITQGPLSAPNSSSSINGQDSWSGPNLAWAYPSSFSSPENDWVDVEVTIPSDTASGSMSLGPFAMASSANVSIPQAQANFDDDAINEVIDKIVSFALASGRFDSVNGHEPKSAPGNGIVFAVWAQAIKPARMSGLAATSALVQFQGRIYIPFNQVPYDAIDPKVMAATTNLMAAFSGDFNFGGAADVRYVDLLGAEGANLGMVGLSAQAGYVEIDRRMYRIMTLNIPIVINDAFKQVALWLSHPALETTSTSVATTSAVTSPPLTRLADRRRSLRRRRSSSSLNPAFPVCVTARYSSQLCSRTREPRTRRRCLRALRRRRTRMSGLYS